jgi:hypothetical protein
MDDDFEPSPAMQLAHQADPDFRFARFVSGLIALAIVGAIALAMFLLPRLT